MDAMLCMVQAAMWRRWRTCSRRSRWETEGEVQVFALVPHEEWGCLPCSHATD